MAGQRGPNSTQFLAFVSNGSMPLPVIADVANEARNCISARPASGSLLPAIRPAEKTVMRDLRAAPDVQGPYWLGFRSSNL
jgi:hypothetical protein